MMTMSPKCGDEYRFDIVSKTLAVDGTVNKPRGLDPIVAQRGHERCGLPAAVRDLGHESAAARRPSSQRRHVGLGPGLVDEDQALRRDAILILCPLRPPPRHVRTVAFASHHAFFKAQLLGMDELPDRSIIDLETALGKVGHEPA
jgi:hypothetical protein